ncbi:MAG: ATP-binding protein [Vulcanimicrobiota bacterium]
MKSIRFRLLSVTLLAVMGPLAVFSRLLNDQLWGFYVSRLDLELEAMGYVISEDSVPILLGEEPREELAAVVERWDRLMGVRIIVADADGTIQAGTIGFASLKVGTEIDDTFTPGLRAALRGSRNSTTWRGPDQDYEETMYVNVPILSEDGEVLGAVRVSYSLGQVKSGITNIRHNLWLGFGVYVVLLTLIIVLLATSLARPVESLRKDAQIISGGVLDHRIEPYGPSEIKELGDTLNQMTERLAGLEGQRRRYVSDVSHELRSPLAAIRSMTETLIEHGDDDPELKHRYLPRIVSQTDRLARLATQLLDLAQIEGDDTTQQFEKVCLRGVVDEVLQTTERAAGEAGVTVTTELESSSLAVPGSRDQIVQMLLNLVENAIRYTPEGSLVAVAGSREKDRVVLSVRDNGPGIEEKSLPFLFERFYRVDQARTPNRGGTGLGLSIVQRIVQAHGGSITVESELGEGTLFRIELPGCVEKE